MAQEVLILTGLPASGKSTYAREWLREGPDFRVRINWDDLRLEMFGPGWHWNRKDEDQMQANSRLYAELALKAGKSVVIDNTNLTPKGRQKWIDLATNHKATPNIHEIHDSIEACIERDHDRSEGIRVGRAVIERMALFNGFYDWNAPEWASDEPYFVIFDVDGTLANTDHRKHFMEAKPKNWVGFFNGVSEDPVHEPIKNLAGDLYALGYKILVVSGRPTDLCGIKTEDWLDENHIPYDALFMRQGGDHRSDVIVKQEILDLLPKDRIAYVVDDRDQVVEMWRKNGLTCLQVAKGDF